MNSIRKPGKHVGSCVYVHHLYETEVVPLSLLTAAKAFVTDRPQYTCVKYDKGNGNITFQWSADFDEADEPTVGLCILVRRDGTTRQMEQRANPQIWHHKWLWVQDDYDGFDVEAAKQRSALWLPHIQAHERARIGYRSFWDSIRHRWETE